MQIPLELDYRDQNRSPWSEALIRRRVERLGRYCDRIVSCHVVVSRPHRHRHKGNAFRVSVELKLPPNRRLAAVEEPTSVEGRADLRATIDSAFQAIERQLEGEGRTRLREALAPAPDESRGLVVRLDPEGGYGFLRTPAGEDYYFHPHSVLHGDFGRLAVGTEVRFEPSEGEEGPQASTVQIVNKPGARETEETRDRDDVPPEWRNTAG
jgi:cold shock CspA family protein/ribosome-associated translation inhibitor RaiA